MYGWTENYKFTMGDMRRDGMKIETKKRHCPGPIRVSDTLQGKGRARGTADHYWPWAVFLLD